ncbi:MAG: hypothetical protein KTR31_31160 [Myxococcales bacterium]|nr:hypothetical protein [Myxococcales bacterium]
MIRSLFSFTALMVASVAAAAPLELPHDFESGDTIRAADFNDNFEEIAFSVNDNDARLEVLEDDLSVVAGVPAGAVMFFNLGTCPQGWGELTALRGRVPMGLPAGGILTGQVGAALDDQGTRTITDVPSHTHSVNPPSTATATSGNHNHLVDPPSTTTSTNGSHTHVVDNGNGGVATTHLQASNTAGDSAVADSSSPISSAGSHTHTLNIPGFNTVASGNHTHTVDIASFSSGSTGVGAVDVTMPYIQLLACQKD